MGGNSGLFRDETVRSVESCGGGGPVLNELEANSVGLLNPSWLDVGLKGTWEHHK